MDKYVWYVAVTYLVTFGILTGYLFWLWGRLKAEREELERE